MAGKNKLRGEKSKTPVIIFLIILFLILFTGGMYIAYLLYNYELKTGLEKIALSEIMDVMNYIAAPEIVKKFDVSMIPVLFKYQVTKIWWIYVAVFLILFLNMSDKKDDFKGMEHGSASWADKYDEKSFKDNTGIPVAKDMYVTILNPKKKYYSSHNLNEVVIGGSGAGKSFRKIKVDIMQKYGSYVITDPKGELYRDTAKFLKENGYKIRVLNLINIGFSNSYNPFAYMSEEQDVLNVADLFMKNSAGEGEKEDFWTGAAQDMLVAIMVYLWKNKDETQTFGRVLRLVNSIQYKDGKIDPVCELARCFNAHMIDYPNDVVAVNWASIQGTPQETLGSICKTLSTRLRLWAVEAVDEVTAVDEMDFDNIGKEKTAVFLLIPAARQTYKVIANIFYSQLFERLMLVANRDCNGRLPNLVSCELDEFANIGKIPNFNETLAVVRSHNIRLCIVLQGLSQLKALYEKTWESIIGNCSIFTFLGTNDMDSKEYVSKKLGKTTVRVDSRSYNRGNTGGGSDSENYIQRDLLSADEIPKAIRAKGKTKKYGGSCIIFVDEYKPFFLPKYDTLKHPVISSIGSQYEKDFHNNTNIEKEYADIKRIRHDNYTAQVKDYFEKRKNSEETTKQKEIESEEKHQEKLKQMYQAAQVGIDMNDFEEMTNEIEINEQKEFSDGISDVIDEDEFETAMDEAVPVISDDVNPIISKFMNQE